MTKNPRKRSKPLHAIFIAAAVIVFWRGAWGLMDVYLFPDNDTLSYGVSLLAGILLYVFITRHHGNDLT